MEAAQSTSLSCSWTGMSTLLLLQWALLFPLGLVTGIPELKGMRHQCYAKQRDLNIAVFSGLSTKLSIPSQLKCSREVPHALRHIYSVAVEYALDEVNARSDLLPNISLGFVMLDYCGHHLTALADMLYILPYEDKVEETSSSSNEVLTTCEDGWRQFKVIGGVGPGYSSSAVMIGGLSTIFHIPLVLTTASSDELSDKTRFAYTMRVVPPDRIQTEALTDILVHFGWDYASLIYSEGAYGESGAKQIERNAKIKGICLAFRYMIPSDYSDVEIREVAHKMSIYRDARVIISFTEGSIAMALAPFLEQENLVGHFTWVASDYFEWPKATDFQLGPHLDGGLSLDFRSKISDKYRRYFRTITAKTHPDDPFVKMVYAVKFDCEWNRTLGNRSCYEYESQFIGEEPDSGWESTYFDAINVYVNALQALITENCPQAFVDKSYLDDCVTGERLHKYMLEVEFHGLTGHVVFDAKGDLLGAYNIHQYQLGKGAIQVGTWEKEKVPSLNLMKDKLKWKSSGNISKDVMVTVPESLCSRPCQLTEYYILKELPCCWDCRRCRNNEILVGNRTGCSLCELLTWPDPDTLTTCLPIEPEQLSLHSPLVMSMLTVTSAGMAVCAIVGVIFVKKSQDRLIKASSRQLMAIILVGIVMAYLTVVVLLLPASDLSCYLSRFGFNLSVSFIYSPLMVKTSRIYRIFTAGKQGTKRPKLVGTKSQLLLVMTCILIQFGLCVVSAILYPPLPLLRQQVPTEQYVEILCSLPLSGLIPPLSLNLLFVLVCAVYGFLTRKLPENFNESWYIFVSVATTTFLWLVFLPAYFTAFYAVHQIVLLASCLIFNGTATLLCLYIPKIYCIYFVDADQVKFQTAGTVGTMSVAPATEST